MIQCEEILKDPVVPLALGAMKACPVARSKRCRLEVDEPSRSPAHDPATLYALGCLARATVIQTGSNEGPFSLLTQLWAQFKRSGKDRNILNSNPRTLNKWVRIIALRTLTETDGATKIQYGSRTISRSSSGGNYVSFICASAYLEIMGRGESSHAAKPMPLPMERPKLIPY